MTSAAFNLGIESLKNTLDTNANERLVFERDRNLKTFTERHGDALAELLYRHCGVDTDAALPEVHQLLAKSPKSRDYGILSAALAKQAGTTGLPVTDSTKPVSGCR